ncbi:hypothetical protein D8674_008360 [Pyrus ussuriensis x Pyrus communis]|uniref:Uncharacterized protein n=1 Tax=Pyrus ussuriensis x Pyrus communis TaxID=2448454 RepID=A0A5N5HX76_9ROSA|nr:hypothetical protein D8674_008360 [Pyrus ussuriensis x Pyrus communis]
MIRARVITKRIMDLKGVRMQILHGPLVRRVFFRAFFIATAMSIIPLIHILSGTYMTMFTFVNPGDCAAELGHVAPIEVTAGKFNFQSPFFVPFWRSNGSEQCKRDVNLTVSVVRELMGQKLLKYGTRALCVGEGSASAGLALQDLGFPDARGVYKHRFFSLKHKQFVYEIDYEDKSFDFVLSRDLDKVSVPALLVLEIERVLSPGGIGAMLVGSSVSSPNSLIRSATPISSLLKSSSVVHVNYVNNFTLVVFKKNYDNARLFKQYHLPADCPSLTNNRPFIGIMEPLVKEKPAEYGKRYAYLPNFVDVSSKRRLVYIDIGAAAHLNANVTNWFLPSYPIERKDFNVYFVDHNTSVLLSYVKKPGITFVYHPGLAGINPQVNVPNDGITDPYVGDEGFDFLVWFKETVGFADFVVLKMNAGNVELKFLTELFESGAICFVDELFLHCSGQVDAGGEMPVDCMDIFGSLRSSGVFVHQWWGDGNPGDVLLSVG